jgi:hypothetical protein
MHLIYPTSIRKWDIHDLYNYTRPIRAIHNLYKSALAWRILFYFLRSLYVYSSPYSTRDTHYRLIEYITFGVLLCVTHSDHLAVPTNIEYWHQVCEMRKARGIECSVLRHGPWQICVYNSGIE